MVGATLFLGKVISVIKTPPYKWHIAALAAILWLLIPIFNTAYYVLQQARHAYPANADSIAIPIFTEAIAWAVFTPVFGLLAWLVVRTYRGGVSLWAFDTDRPVRSVIVSLVWGGLAGLVLFMVCDDLMRRNFVDPLLEIAWVYLFLCLRSSAAGPQGRQK